jgi:hypothetical protein
MKNQHRSQIKVYCGTYFIFFSGEQNNFLLDTKNRKFFLSFSLTDVPAGAVESQFGERQGSQGPESMPRAYDVIRYAHAHFAQVFLSASSACWLFLDQKN